MLGNSIALLTLALMLASEGRRSEGAWRAGLFTLATVVALAALALEPIVTRVPAIGTALSAVFGNPLAWFVLFMGLFFVMRPFWLRRQSSGAVDFADLDFGGKDEEIRKMGVSISEIVQCLERQEGRWKSHETALDELRKSVEEIGFKVSHLQGEVVARDSLAASALATRLKNVHLSLKAIWHRERLEARREAIEKQAEVLSKPETAKAIIDGETWTQWEEVESDWRDHLARWCELAEVYREGVTLEVFDTSESDYRGGKWEIEDKQFPNADAVYVYKTFRIIQRNWESVVDDVEVNVCKAAYDGQACDIVGKDYQG